MPTLDPAKAIKDALHAHWAPPTVDHPEYEGAHPTWAVTLHVDEDYRPTALSPTLLVADDGGPAIHGGPWILHAPDTGRGAIRRPLIRMTVFAEGRSEARAVIDEAVDWILVPVNRPAGIGRIDDISDILLTRDRATGAFLASVTMPIIVRPLVIL